MTRRLVTPNEAVKQLQSDVRDLQAKLGRIGREVTGSTGMHNEDISTSGPGPDVWPRGIVWAQTTSDWTGRPGSSNGLLVSYNAGDFVQSYQTFFTGSTMYVRNRDTASAWGSWRVAWGPV